MEDDAQSTHQIIIDQRVHIHILVIEQSDGQSPAKMAMQVQTSFDYLQRSVWLSLGGHPWHGETGKYIVFWTCLCDWQHTWLCLLIAAISGTTSRLLYHTSKSLEMSQIMLLVTQAANSKWAVERFLRRKLHVGQFYKRPSGHWKIYFLLLTYIMLLCICHNWNPALWSWTRP